MGFFSQDKPKFQALSPRQTDSQLVREPRQPFQSIPSGWKHLFCFYQAGATCLLFTWQLLPADGEGLGQRARSWEGLSIHLKEAEQLHNY